MAWKEDENLSSCCICLDVMTIHSHTISNTAAQPLDKKARWSVPRWLKITSTLGVLLLLSWQVRWHDVVDVLSTANVLGVLAAVALWLPNQWLQYARWKFIVQRAAIQPLISDIRESYWLGHTLGFITPGRIGSYGRGLFLSNVPLGEATALTVLERSYSAITVNGFGLIALAILPSLGWHATWADWGREVSAVLFIIGLIVLLAGVFPGQIARAISKFAGQRSWGKVIANSLGALSHIPLGASLLYLGLASASLIVSLVQFLLILNALGIVIPVVAGLLAIHLNFFLKGNIPLTLGSLGVGEWTALLCLRGLGVPDSMSVAASLMLFSLNVAIPALIGVRFVKRVFTVHHGWNNRGK
ncbi:MAG: flippase-like domain-containing protein [bacterium]|nr:flippase-like domain-containing protein [bacterium]